MIFIPGTIRFGFIDRDNYIIRSWTTSFFPLSSLPSVCFWCSGNSSESLDLLLLEPVCGRLSAIFVVLVLICHNEYGYMYIQNDFDPQNVINRLLKRLLVMNDIILDTVALIFTTCWPFCCYYLEHVFVMLRHLFPNV